MEKYLDDMVIWSMALKLRGWDGSVFETLTPSERGSIPEYAELQVHDVFLASHFFNSTYRLAESFAIHHIDYFGMEAQPPLH